MDEETETDTKKKERRIDLSVAQVAGSALAAAVAAYLAGRLGVYGTIIGAGLVSVVATTGGSIFHHLFRRTGEQIKEATVSTRPKPRRFSSRTRSTAPHTRQAGTTLVLPTFDKQGTEDEVTSVAARAPGRDTARTQLIPRAEQARRRDPASAHPESDDATGMLRTGHGAIGAPRSADGTGRGRPADRTQLVPRLDARPTAPGRTAARPAAVPEEIGTATYGTRLRGWKRPALGALAVFVLAMGVVTVTELATGQTPSGQKGTTLSNITHTGGGSRQQPSTPRSPGSGSEEDRGRHGHNGEPDPDRGTSDDPGTGKGTDGDSPPPSPDPSGGGKTSPDPHTSPSPESSPDESTGDGGTGDGDTSTGGQDQGDQQGQQESGKETPAPEAS
ncbi:hypothetical protein [Streptomyces sp. NPDC048611]|uniref:hypothetical protein n=1 Tax=Streptomyces sp. NPDC048611 TaxID=3155635 RepID=UPI003423AB7E